MEKKILETLIHRIAVILESHSTGKTTSDKAVHLVTLEVVTAILFAMLSEDQMPVTVPAPSAN